MKRHWALIMSISLVSCNCGDNEFAPDAYYETYTESFVMMYRTLVSLDAYVMDNNSIWLYENTDGKEITRVNAPEEFSKLCREHEDTGYNRTIKVHYGMGPNEYISQSFSGIEVISDTDYDEVAAGNSLNGKVNFMALTPNPYINSNYQETFDWSKCPDLEMYRKIFRELLYYYNADLITLGRENLHPVNKPASELTVDDLTLLGRGFYVVPNQRPQRDPLAVVRFMALLPTTKFTISKLC